MYHLLKGLYLYATSKEGPPHPVQIVTSQYSLLLLGLDNAGKTTLLNQIKALYASSTDSTSLQNPSSSSSPGATPARPDVGKTVPTVGQNVSTITLPDLYLRIWDIGGQHSLRSLWHSYYASCHAIVFVIDSSDVGDLEVDLDGRRGRAHDSETADTVGETAPAAGGTGGGRGGRRQQDGSTPSTGRLEECRLVLEDVLAHSDAHGVPVLVLANKQDREDCVEVVRVKEGLVRKVFEGEHGGRGVRDSRVLPVSALTGTGVREAVEWVRSRVKWNREARPAVLR